MDIIDLRGLIEQTKKALKYFSSNGQGTSTGRSGEPETTHLRGGEDTIRDKGLPEGEQEFNKD